MKKSQQAGFTMLELVVALALFAIIIPTLAIGVNNLTVINNRSRDLSLASTIAENKAELLRSAGFNSLNSGTTDFTSELPNELASPKSASYTVTDSGSGIKEINISISYKDYGSTISRAYKTIVSELGVGQ